jgi:hypothetical protein
MGTQALLHTGPPTAKDEGERWPGSPRPHSEHCVSWLPWFAPRGWEPTHEGLILPVARTRRWPPLPSPTPRSSCYWFAPWWHRHAPIRWLITQTSHFH